MRYYSGGMQRIRRLKEIDPSIQRRGIHLRNARLKKFPRDSCALSSNAGPKYRDSVDPDTSHVSKSRSQVPRFIRVCHIELLTHIQPLFNQPFTPPHRFLFSNNFPIVETSRVPTND